MNNKGKDPRYSEALEHAVISFKVDRGTSYETFIKVRNEITAAYNRMRSEYLNMTVDQYLKLDPSKDEDNAMLQEARKAIPMSFVEAEPNNYSK